MSDSVLLGLALVGLLATLTQYLQRRRMIQGVDRIPGPAAYPIIGNTIDLVGFNFNLTNAVEFWTEKYGYIFRLWFGLQPFIVLSKPADLEILLTSTKHIEKAALYDSLRPWIGDGLLTSTGKKWHSRRKLITPTFHFKILDQFVEVFNRNGDVLANKLLATKGTVNVQDFVALYALDVICETAMGTRVEAQNDSKSPYVMAVHDAVVSFHERMMKPWLHPDVLFNLSPTGRTFNRALKVLHKYTRDVIEHRREEQRNRAKSQDSLERDDDLGMRKREAFLDHLLQASDATGANLDDDEIQEEVDTFMFEGHDTTSAALSFILYNVAANPEVQDMVAEEVRGILGDSDRAATSQDIHAMKYTERVIRESLRLYPSVPLFGRFLREDVAITDGYVLPAGANISISCLQMGRDATQWPDPLRFDPDRHLPENAAGRHNYGYIPFSAGPRNCIGQKFAMMEMKSAVSKVVRSCRIGLPAPDYEPRAEGQVILKAPEGVLLNFAPRE